MKNIGIDPVTECTLTTVNDIPSEITAVLNGQQDACFVFEGARHVFKKAFPDNDLTQELKVLYLSEGNIPNDAIAVSPDMDEELQNKIVEVFTNMANDEQGKEAMSMWSHIGYEKADEKAYDTVKAYTEKAAE